MILVNTFYAHNELRNFSYLITDDQTGDSWVIDPYDAKPIINYIKQNGLIVKGILNTHQHFDHVRGNEELLSTFDTHISKLKGSEKIILNDTHEIQFIDTPGHTMDHQVFVWRQNNRPVALFSGDSLFNAGVGNCKGGGDVNALFDSTEKLIHTLPQETLLYPGHDYIQKNLEFALSCEPENKNIQEKIRELKNEPVEQRKVLSLKEELNLNPFLRLDSAQLRHNLAVDENGKDELFKRNLFHKLRSLRDKW